MDAPRDLHFDFIKGVCIVAVVVIHATNAVLWGAQSEPSALNFYFSKSIGKACSFAVPAFFFVAGYFSHSNSLGDFERYRGFLVKRIKRLIIPYLFWSTVIICVIHQNPSLNNYIYRLLLGKAIEPYYFIIALLQLIIITPALQFMVKRKTGIVAMLAFGSLCIAAVYLFEIFSTTRLQWWVPLLFCGTWVIFYFSGMLLKEKGMVYLFYRFRKLTSAIGLMGFAFILLFAEKYGLQALFDGQFGDVKFSWVFYGLAGINFLLVIKDYIPKPPMIAVRLGQWSFGIYLIHEIFRGPISNALGHFDPLYAFQPLFQPIVVVLTIGLCALIIAGTKKIFGAMSETLLGF